MEASQGMARNQEHTINLVLVVVSRVSDLMEQPDSLEQVADLG